LPTPARTDAAGRLPVAGHGEERRREGKGFAQLLARPRRRHTGRHADGIGHGDLVRIGPVGTFEVALLLVRVPPEGTDQQSIATNGPGRYAGMKNRRARHAAELRYEEIVRGLERERPGSPAASDPNGTPSVHEIVDRSRQGSAMTEVPGAAEPVEIIRTNGSPATSWYSFWNPVRRRRSATTRTRQRSALRTVSAAPAPSPESGSRPQPCISLPNR
jgi:hypothetical protein